MKTEGYVLFVGSDLNDAINNGVFAMHARIYDTPEEALKFGSRPNWYPGRCVARKITLGEALVICTEVKAVRAEEETNA